MIAFLVEHESSSKPLSFFAVSVDSIEVLTGIDFFEGMDNEQEMIMESGLDLANWKF